MRRKRLRQIPLFLWTTALAVTISTAVTGLEGGFKTGGLFASTEAVDQPGFAIRTFLRRPLAPKWQGELALGYGRMRGENYATDLSLIDAKALFTPATYEDWNPYLYGGLGLLRYNISDLPATRTVDAKGLGTGLTVPLGIGGEVPLNDGLSLDFAVGYTYTFRDDLDGLILEKGNDVFWNVTVGLIWRARPSHSTRPAAQPIPPSSLPQPATEDRDGDGLTDREETRTYFTNPLMTDSDGDGLSDFDEVKIHGTNPNRTDSDGDGNPDGAAVIPNTHPPNSDDTSGDQ